MRPMPTRLRPTCRRLALPRRHITTKPATFANIKYELLSRQPHAHWDDLSPRSSNLLARTLSDLLPAEAQTQTSSSRPRLNWGHHLVYFAPCHPTTSLLPDGTDADHSPGPPFTRRLWAGGSLSFPRGGTSSSLQVPTDATRGVCVEEVEDVRVAGVPPGEEARTGRTPGAGEKVFVDLVRRYGWAGGEVVDEEMVARVRSAPEIEERRTLCFMAPKTAEEARRDVESPHRRAGRAPSYEPTYSFSLVPTPALLFRFSALTFNAHAIHLDRQHCREVEGYRDLLVHGPLLLTFMFAGLKGALSQRPDAVVTRLDYRNLAPVYVGEELKVCVRESRDQKLDVWVVGPEGGLCVKGTAVVEGP